MTTQPTFATFAYGNFANAPTLVFLHDSLGCIELWRDFPQRVADILQCNIFVYDRLGYGKSSAFVQAQRGLNYMEIEADTLMDVLDAQGIQSAILFGHSDGGSIALMAAAKYPDRIGGIMTEGAHIFVEDITLQGIRDAIRAYQTTNLPAKLAKYHGANTDAMFWAWAGTWTQDFFKTWNIEHFLPLIQCPTLVLQGEHDEFGTIRQVERIAQQVSGNVVTTIIPNAKHTPHKETPEQVLELVRVFWTSYIVDNQ